MRPVAVTMQNETDAVIAKGVGDGDRVVTTGFARLKDGSSVTVAKPEEQKSGPPDAKPEVVSEARVNVRAACADDIQKLCANAKRSGGCAACLQTNAAKLSDTCKVAIAAARGGKRARSRRTQG